MAYTKTVWQDRIVQFPMCFTFASVNGGTQLTPNEGTVTQAGTPISASTMNNIENGLENVDTRLTTAESTLTGKVSKTGDTMSGTLTAPTVNATSNLQENGVNLSAKYLLLTGGTVNGTLNVTGQFVGVRNGANIIAKGTASGNSNLADLTIQDSAGTVQGQFGAIATGNTDVQVKASLTDLILTTTSGTVRVTDDLVVTGTTQSTGAISSSTSVSAPTINATGNLQEGGTNLSSKYLLLTGGTLTGDLTITKSSGSTTINMGSVFDNGRMKFINNASTNRIQSGVEDFSSAKNLAIEGNGANLDIPTLTVRATSTTFSGTISEGGTLLTSKYLQLTGGTMTGNLAIDRNTAGSSLLNVKNSADDGGMRLITTAGTNFLQSGNYAGSSPKNFTINGWSSTTIPTFNITATTTNFNGGDVTVSGTISEGGTLLSNKYLALVPTSMNISDGTNVKPFFDTNVGNSGGIGVYVGSGGMSVFGGGESATTLKGQTTDYPPTSEFGVLAGDSQVHLVSNVQTYASRHSFIMDSAGKITVDGNLLYENTPVWTNLTLLNGTTANGTRTPRFMKRNGVVYVQGEITTVANGTVIANLPAGYRPSNGTGINFVCAIADSGTMRTALLSVGTSGDVTMFVTSGGASPICLNNIQFPADV